MLFGGGIFGICWWRGVGSGVGGGEVVVEDEDGRVR